ncbi:MAG: glycerophosphodiester phosphodiesterase, partial [Gammaproteobacteria bacterium]|nr:glycerophosphodiester phosphodiesterase [Gammaproteobacteria bacterium]
AAFPDARFNIDPKSDAAVGPLIDIIRHMDAEQRVCIGSFYGRRLRWVRDALPGVCTSMARAETTYARFASLGLPWRSGGAACAQVPVWWNRILVVDSRFVQTMHAQGIPVHVWTVNNIDEMHRLLDLGVDGLMTDYPAKLKSVLLARGQWHQPC